MLDTARRDVRDEALSEKRRVACINLLGRDRVRRAADRELLLELLSPDKSPVLQAAAAAALGRFADAEAGTALTANWRSYTPALKSQVIDILLSREPWQLHLLENIPPTEVDATRRQRLLTSPLAHVKNLAAERFAGAPSPDRKQVLEDYSDVAALRGDRDRGKAVFAKTCAVCHRLGDAGFAVGPDLAALANKTPQYLLQEILDPNRNVDSRYISYVAVTKAGRALSGLLASETPGSITLKGQEGKQEVILRSDLEELQSSTMSLMPVGLEKDLSKQNLADLIAYLAAVGPRPKAFAGNSPTTISPKSDEVTLLATTAEIYGDQIAFEALFRNIGYWHAAGDHVVWTVELEKPARFDVWLDWACDDAVAGNKFIIAGGREMLRGRVAGTGGWDRYRQQKIGEMKLPAGLVRVSLRPDGDVAGALMDVRSVHLVAPGKSPLFAAADSAPEERPQADTAAVARQILDAARPAKDREELIRVHLGDAAGLIAAMTSDLTTDSKEQYRRIPWIWRVAVAAGRKNESGTLRKLLDTALPKRNEALRDWQAVVIGGGIINGISEQNVWPRERIDELLNGDAELTRRWQQMLTQAFELADNEKAPTGTRYDALRIVALAGWKERGGQLAKYLQKGIHDELQMGAISGAADIEAPEVAEFLVQHFGHFSKRNRELAIDALLRTEPRTIALVEALEQKRIRAADLSAKEVEALGKLKNETLRARAKRALSP